MAHVTDVFYQPVSAAGRERRRHKRILYLWDAKERAKVRWQDYDWRLYEVGIPKGNKSFEYGLRKRKEFVALRGTTLYLEGKAVGALSGGGLVIGRTSYKIITAKRPRKKNDETPYWFSVSVRKGDREIAQSAAAMAWCGMDRGLAAEEESVVRRVAYYLAWRELLLSKELPEVMRK